jgi:hypothetical protein
MLQPVFASLGLSSKLLFRAGVPAVNWRAISPSIIVTVQPRVDRIYGAGAGDTSAQSRVFIFPICGYEPKGCRDREGLPRDGRPSPRQFQAATRCKIAPSLQRNFSACRSRVWTDKSQPRPAAR